MDFLFYLIFAFSFFPEPAVSAPVPVQTFARAQPECRCIGNPPEKEPVHIDFARPSRSRRF
ncbi:MAG: hypothetical protein JWO13_2266 [Acidobacteriales bacterium]|nr:hypothetical protein [Terriglobales bacterium]